MQLSDFVRTVGQEWMRRYRGRVGKLSLSAGFTCPNRDGTVGRGGCSFCSVSSFSGARETSVSDQIRAQKDQGSDFYFAYFQAYTSTYGEVESLKKLYDEALSHESVIGLSVGTRPDCISDECLDLLSSYQDAGSHVIVELGLQSIHDRTLRLINRGHDAGCYRDSARRILVRGLELCTHLIVGLPGESLDDNLISLEAALESGSHGLKLHPLHIVRGSRMASDYRRGEIRLLSRDEYVARAGEMIARTPSRIVYHRVSATAMDGTLIAPEYCRRKFEIIDSLTNYLARYGVQGSAVGDPYVPEELTKTDV
ncbi:MAG: TIGR01212 family radical SAM protein [Succinivibrionaceae bacterium]|nr:TIGR01212 family radical SAM protein [Succinivibrionaceae bacterium]